MKLIIAGSRTINISTTALVDFIHHYELQPTELVCGMAKGVDKSAEKLYFRSLREPGLVNGLHHIGMKKIKRFRPDWETHGKAAGPIRNREMAAYADALLLVWDGKSRGSKNMKEEMLKLNKPVHEVLFPC